MTDITTNVNACLLLKKNKITMIEVCIATYQRPERIKSLMEQFAKQTYKDFKVNIWNNSGQDLGFSIKEFFKKYGLIITEYGAGTNIGSQARFQLVKFVKGSPIIFLDDDESITNDFVEYHYEQYKKYGKNCILGWYTKVFHQEEYKINVNSGEYGQFVDYIGTGGMVLDREIFDQEKYLTNIPREYAKVEDLYLGVIARKRGMELRRINAKCKIINDNKDQCNKLGGYKQNAFKQLRNEGWKIIKDMKFKIYTTPNCSHCEKAKQWFTERKYQFETIDVTQDEKARDLIIKETGMIAAPVIKVGEQYLIGFSPKQIEETMQKFL